MIAGRNLVLQAIERTRREIADPLGTTGLTPRGLTVGTGEHFNRVTLADNLRDEARPRLEILLALLALVEERSPSQGRFNQSRMMR